MATYTKLSHNQLSKIIGRYDLNPVSNISPMAGGNSNTSFLIEKEEAKYVLTILEEKNEEQVSQLALLLKWLKKHQFDTTRICRTTKGRHFTLIKKKPVIIKKWIKGGIIDELNTPMLKRAGKALAQLHLVPVPDFLPKTHSFGIKTFKQVLNSKLDLKYVAWLQKKMHWINRKFPEKLPKGIVHGDLFFDNIIFKRKKLKAIIDFEEACQHYLAFDLGMSIVGLCKEGESINLKKARAFISGYEKIRPLTKGEKKHLQFFTEYAAISTSKWRFWKYNIESNRPGYENKHWEMVNTAKYVHKIPKNTFAKDIFNDAI